MSMVGEKSWEITTNMALVGQFFNYGFYNKKYVWLHFNEMVLNFTDFEDCYLTDGAGMRIKCYENMNLTNSTLKGKKILKVTAENNVIKLIFEADLLVTVESPEKAMLEDIIVDDFNDYCGG